MTVHAFPSGEAAEATEGTPPPLPSRAWHMFWRCVRILRGLVEGFGWLGIALALLLT
ncbi:hypothetical protein GL279_15580 [Paracoccus limosus]|uniref:Uncharacterized protein n=1 Tax=Paracoccus limosus TaxID=913252 RepID=A0A844H5F8_9RHOB|nr:hypothetical protein [Paracoccus limosus]MTH36022.1 hypothetical protein [Paracoccus limosus]